MIKRVVLVGAALLATCAMVQGQDQVRPKRHQKAAEASKTSETAKTSEAATPGEDVPLPAAAQKWFGDTVDGILTGADETLNGRPASKK